MSSRWYYDPHQEGEPYNFYGYALKSLPTNKQGLFVVERGKQGAELSYNPNRTSKQVATMMEKAFAGVGEREYKKFLDYLRKVDNTKELPPGFADERMGFSNYLSLLEAESGYYMALFMALSIEMGRPMYDNMVRTMRASISGNLVERRTEQVLAGEYTYRAAKLFQVPNDKVAHNIREGVPLEWETGIFNIKEKPPKAKKAVLYKVSMDLTTLHAMGFTRLDVFDFLVFHACVAIQLEGNEVTTLQSIYRAMTGKDGKQGKNVSETMLVDIHKSIVKLMSIPVEFNIQGILQAYDPTAETLPKNPIDTFLPAYTMGKTVIQGQEVDTVVKFRDKAPLVKVAEAKGGQFARFDTALLNVPLNSTRQNIVIAPNLLRRMEDTRTGKVSTTMGIDDFMKLCEYTGERRRFVQALDKCCAYWKKQGYLKSYSFIAKRKEPAVKEKLKFSLTPRPSDQEEK